MSCDRLSGRGGGPEGSILSHDDSGIRISKGVCEDGKATPADTAVSASAPPSANPFGAIAAPRIGLGLNDRKRRRNRAIRAACKAFILYAPTTVMHVVRERRRGHVIRIEPRADVLAHADLMRALDDANLTHAEERCFRRVMLGVDTEGRFIVQTDEFGRRYLGPMSVLDVAAEYDLPDATVRRYVSRAMVKIRYALYGPDEQET
jgi:hypothetical protein